MIRLNLPSGTIATVSFIHRRDPHYVVRVGKKVLSSRLPILDNQQPTWEDAVTYAKLELEFRNGQTLSIEAQAQCSRDEMFCYYKGRYEALQNVFKAEVDLRNVDGTGRLLQPFDKVVLLQYFAPQKFTKTKADAKKLKQSLMYMWMPLPKRAPVGEETVVDTFDAAGNLVSERVTPAPSEGSPGMFEPDDMIASEQLVEQLQTDEMDDAILSEMTPGEAAIVQTEELRTPAGFPLVG